MRDVSMLDPVGEGAVYQGPTAKEQRFDEVEAELAELCGQRNAIDGRIAELLAAVDDEDLIAGTGLKSVEHFATWQLGCSRGRARDLVAIAERLDELPVTTGLLREGLLSADQVAVIARRAPAGTDQDYAELAQRATVSQLQRALRAERTRTNPDEPAPASPPSPPERQVSVWWDDDDAWNAHVRLPKVDGAAADAALRSHLDALVNEWKRAQKEREGRRSQDETVPPFPTLADAFLRLLEHGWDADVTARPHAHRTTVVLHVDIESKAAELHLGPALTDAERRYLSCDAKIETWFERDGVPIGAARTSRDLPRRLRRALEHRARGCCEVPGCSATAGLHAHHLIHWEDGGPTELWNVALVCPFHHRAHHAGIITIRGPASALQVTDRRGRTLSAGGLARSPSGPPVEAEQYRHPTGEPFHERWFQLPSLH
jgi:aryl carrier-like protein